MCNCHFFNLFEQKKYIYWDGGTDCVLSISISFALKAARSADITNTCAVLHSALAHYVWKLPLDVSRCRSTRSPSGPHLKLGRDLKAEHWTPQTEPQKTTCIISAAAQTNQHTHTQWNVFYHREDMSLFFEIAGINILSGKKEGFFLDGTKTGLANSILTFSELAAWSAVCLDDTCQTPEGLNW